MKQQYALILLDADGTLMDFSRAQAHALGAALSECSLPGGEEVLAKYSAINEGYWRLLEQGKVTKSQLVVERFRDLLSHLKVKGDPEQLNRRFLYHLGEADFLLEGALETCEALAKVATLAIATNGVVSVQTRRLEKSPLAPYISQLIVSEAAGAAKPDTRFFDYAFSLCGPFDRSQTLMVGDSLAADIAGGIGYGIDTCWYNPEKLDHPPHLTPTYQIRALTDLVKLVSRLYYSEGKK